MTVSMITYYKDVYKSFTSSKEIKLNFRSMSSNFEQLQKLPNGLNVPSKFFMSGLFDQIECSLLDKIECAQ